MQLQGPVTVLSGETVAAEEALRGPTKSFGVVVQSKIEKIRVAKLAIGNAKVPKPHFDLGADLKEVSRTDTQLNLKYVLYLDTFPAVQRVEIHGEAAVRSPTIKAYTENDEIDEGLLNDVAMEIFRNHYMTIYLLFDSMRLPAPSPWVLKDVHLV